MLGAPTPYDQQTPGAASVAGSSQADFGERDPFLSLLEQLAENERVGNGPGELDFFLGSGG